MARRKGASPDDYSIDEQFAKYRGGFVKSVILERSGVPGFDRYPFHLPAIRNLSSLPLDPHMTFIIRENGSGKSTLVEAIAVAAGFNAEGGTKNFNFATRRSESPLHELITLARGVYRERDGYFLRAESYFNVATEIERLDKEPYGGAKIISYYGGKSLHEQSHGESFLALVDNRFGDNGLYILDEPEAALSPMRQLTLLHRMNQLIDKGGCQFIMATHSPILMAYPGATIYHLGQDGLTEVKYTETEHYRLTLDFLTNHERYLHHLFRDPDSSGELELFDE
jgi:predicted ATPase